MRENMYNYISPGIIHFMLYPETLEGRGPIIETLENIVLDDFFQAVEVSWIKDKKTRLEVKDLLRAGQMDVYYGAQPRLLTEDLDLNSFDHKKRKNAVAAVKEGVDEALELDARAVAFLSGKNVSEEKIDDAVDLLIDSIAEICVYANSKDTDLKIILEVFDFDKDKCALVGPVEIARKVASEVVKEHDNFGLLIDLSHLPLLDESPEQAIIPVKEYLQHIHIGNAVLDKTDPAYGDSHPRFGLESGENGFKELVDFLRVLLDIEYLDGCEPKTISFEVKPLADESPELIAANSKRIFKKAWARL